MANELLSVPVAMSALGVAGAGLAIICRQARQYITAEKVPFMGILGAFIFAAQMVNFQLPLMPGTSGHLIGSVLLAIVLGPHPGCDSHKFGSHFAVPYFSGWAAYLPWAATSSIWESCRAISVMAVYSLIASGI